MCTVTYLPTGKNSFILTSNRDESGQRPTEAPTARAQDNGLNLYYPRDTFAGGTWICAAEDDRLVCLLNGAFEKHKHEPPYRKSRGLVVLEFFSHENASLFFDTYDLEGIEPFTLVIYDKGKLHECRWDGKEQHVSSLSTDEPHIWASATLYPQEVIEKRKKWFAEWLADKEVFRQEGILHFHRFGGEGDVSNDLVMNRFNLVQTVSITSIEKKAEVATMHYHDLMSDEVYHSKFSITQQVNP